MNLIKWLTELKAMAAKSGYDHLITSYLGHIDSFLSGVTPEQELVRIAKMHIDSKKEMPQ